MMMRDCAATRLLPDPGGEMAGRCLRQATGLAGLLLVLAGCTSASQIAALVVPEQRHLDIREPEQIPTAPIPPIPPPATVANPNPPGETREITLDEAIHIALANTNVVRVLAGVTAVSSGQTIYDPAITNTTVDVARSVFDPVLNVQNTWNRSEQPTAFFDPTSPALAG